MKGKQKLLQYQKVLSTRGENLQRNCNQFVNEDENEVYELILTKNMAHNIIMNFELLQGHAIKCLFLVFTFCNLYQRDYSRHEQLFIIEGI